MDVSLLVLIFNLALILFHICAFRVFSLSPMRWIVSPSRALYTINPTHSRHFLARVPVSSSFFDRIAGVREPFSICGTLPKLQKVGMSGTLSGLCVGQCSSNTNLKGPQKFVSTSQRSVHNKSMYPPPTNLTIQW